MERKWKEYRELFQPKHRNRNLIARKTYNMQSSKCGINKVAAHSRKAVTARYFQLISGDYSHTPPQTVRHLMLNFRKWRRERNNMWNQIKSSGSPIRSRWTKLKLLFWDEKTIAPILKFLKVTEVGMRIINSIIAERGENIGLEDLDADEVLDVPASEESR